MRRAPQLWEQRLARTTSILGAGISRLVSQNEINELKWAAVRVIADTRTESYAAGEADAQARIALGRAIEEGRQ
jgi:hypothetical protein